MCHYPQPDSIPFDNLRAGVFEHARRNSPLGTPIVVNFRGPHGDDFRRGNFAGFSKWEGKYEFCLWVKGKWVPELFRVFTDQVISVHYQQDYRGAKK